MPKSNFIHRIWNSLGSIQQKFSKVFWAKIEDELTKPNPKSLIPLRILCHNICWTESKLNHIRIAEKIHSLQPDIVCLQECVFGSQFRIFESLGYYHSVVPANPTRVIKGGLLVLSKTRPIKVEFVKFTSQGKFFSKQILERRLQKGFLVVELEEYIIINTHLVADHSQKWHEKNLTFNTAQFNQILEFVNNSDTNKPIIICGDLNFRPNNQSYHNLDSIGLTDLTSNIAYTFQDQKTKLDYVIVNQKPQYSNSRIVDYLVSEPSDHYGIMCELSI